MLAGVSHDLKTPLTRMKLQLAMMKKSKFKETFGQNISELENMIGEYLSYAKGEAQEKTTSQKGKIRIQIRRSATRPRRAGGVTTESKQCLCKV